MKRLILPVIAFLLIVLLSGYTWLTHTSSGAQWIAGLLFSSHPEMVEYSKIGGTLANGVNIQNLRVLTDRAEIEVNECSITFQLDRLLFATLAIPSLKADNVIFNYLPASTASPPPSGPQSTGLSLPVKIDVGSAAISTLAIRSKTTNVPRFSKIQVSNLQIARQISIGKLSAQSSIGSIDATGHYPLITGHKMNITINGDIKTANLAKPIKGTLQFEGPLEAISIRASTTSPDRVNFKGTINNVSTSPRWDLTLTSGSVHTQNWYTSPTQMTFRNTRLETKGTQDKFSVAAYGNINNPSLGEGDFQLRTIHTNGIWQVSDFSLLNSKIDMMVALHGTIEAGFTVDKNTVVDVTGNWKNLRWPINANQPRFTSPQGTLVVTGSIPNYRLSVTGALSAGRHKITKINMNATGNQDALDIADLKGVYIGGLWRGKGVINWKNNLTWNTTIAVENADISQVLSKENGTLSGELAQSGQYKDEVLAMAGQIRHLTGDIAGHKIKGNGDFNYKNQQLAISGFDLSVGVNHVAANFLFDFAKNKKIPIVRADWHINGSDLSELYPGLEGGLSSQGTYKETENHPVISANLKSAGLKYDKYSAGNIDAHFDIKGETTHSSIALTSRQLRIGNFEISLFDANLSGNYTSQRFDIHLANARQTATIQGTGKFTKAQWQAVLSTFAVKDPNVGAWSLTNPAALTLSRGGYNLKQACFNSDNREKLCVASHAENDYENISSNVRIVDLSLNRLNQFLPVNIQSIDGNISGDAAVDLQNKQITTLNLDLSSGSGTVTALSSAKEPASLSYQNLHIAIINRNNDLVTHASVQIVNAGYIDANLTLPRAGQINNTWRNQPLKGAIDVRLNDLQKVTIILPNIQKATGTWNTHFAISGTLTNPAIIGSSVLKVSSVYLPFAGIELKNLDLESQTSADYGLNVSGTAESNGGKLSITGQFVDYRPAHLSGNFTIKGDHFKLANLPEASVIASPDLDVSISKKSAQLKGVVTINEANITILTQQSGLSPSADAEVVTKKPEEKAVPKIAFSADVRVTLEKKVWLKGYGFAGHLQGSVLVHQSPGQTPKATGEINIVDGSFGAYGQTLAINSGKVTYAGNSIDNPSIDIRAIREIRQSSTNVITVGLMVTGQAQSPIIKLFSTPTMDDSEILSYLILGYPLSQASSKDGALLANAASSIGLLGGEKLVKKYAARFGIDEVKVQSNSATQERSLVLGKYLSPQLYMSYAIGIGQTVSSLQLQYQIAKNWTLRTESGETQSADILFTIEKE